MISTHSDEVSDIDLNRLEKELRDLGFRITEKSSPKELGPGEYFKRAHHGDAQSFTGERRWTVVRRTK